MRPVWTADAALLRTGMFARIILAIAVGAASLAGAYVSAFLALAALDGGQELPAVVGYGIPIVVPLFVPLLAVRLGLSPKGRWYATTVGVGGALGAVTAILILPESDEFMAGFFFLLVALGAFAGTFGWMPWRETKGRAALGGTN